MTAPLHALQSHEAGETYYTDLDGGLRMQRFGYQKDIWFPSHCHDELSIVVCTSGLIESTQFGLCETLQPGDVVVTNRQITHSSRYYSQGGGASGVAFELDLEGQRWLGLDGVLLMGRMRFEWVLPIIRDLLHEMAERRAHWEKMRNALAHQLVVRLVRDWPPELRRRGGADACDLLTRQEFIEATAAMQRDSMPWGNFTVDFERRFRNTTGVARAEFGRVLSLGGIADAQHPRELLS